ncbi:MAG: hypothetical protein M3R38_31215, partial [Actinomycetota bacterium]|nr:hypothetical protein [Actinomycetota bacterium]
MRRGDSWFRGFWRPQDDWVWWGLNRKPGLEQYHLLETHSGVPGRYAGYVTQPDYSLVGLTYYVANEKPLVGSWRVAPSGTVGDFNPRFEGTLPHPSSEGGRDYTDVVHVRIYDVTAGRMAFEQQFENENRPNVFSRNLFAHQSGHEYWADFRHRDSWGVWSGFSARTYYRTTSGPDRPAFPADGLYGAHQPRKKSDVVSGIRYYARYSHPGGKALGSARVEVRSA